MRRWREAPEGLMGKRILVSLVVALSDPGL
jgi:hypothetical protein